MWYFFIIVVANLVGGFALGCYLGRGFRPAQGPMMAMPPDGDAATQLADSSSSGSSKEKEDESPSSPAAREVNRSPAHLALEAFVQCVDEGRQRLQGAQQRFSAAAGGGNTSLVEACLAAVIEEVRQVADACTGALATFEPAIPDNEAFRAVRARIAEAIDRQSKVVKDAVVTFAAYDPQRIELSIQESAAKFDDLLATSDRVRDQLGGVAIVLAEAEGSFEAMTVDHGTDATTGLPTGLALAVHLHDWWKKDPQRVRRLALGAIDVDELGKLNRQFGYAAGDRFLKGLAALVRGETAKHAFVARVAGTRLVLCGMDEDGDLIGSLVEKIRQTLDTTEVLRGDEKAYATASCAVTDAVRDDTFETLLARLDEAVHAAKRAGRNRTFLHDGTKPTPVVPPNVNTSPRTIDLAAS